MDDEILEAMTLSKDQNVIETNIDLAGKSRVLVDIGGGEAIMLKFDAAPDEKLIAEELSKAIASREAEKTASVNRELQEIYSQIAELQERASQLEAQQNVIANRG